MPLAQPTPRCSVYLVWQRLRWRGYSPNGIPSPKRFNTPLSIIGYMNWRLRRRTHKPVSLFEILGRTTAHHPRVNRYRRRSAWGCSGSCRFMASFFRLGRQAGNRCSWLTRQARQRARKHEQATPGPVHDSLKHFHASPVLDKDVQRCRVRINKPEHTSREFCKRVALFSWQVWKTPTI